MLSLCFRFDSNNVDGHYIRMRSNSNTHMACGIDVDNGWLNIDFAARVGETFVCGMDGEEGYPPTPRELREKGVVTGGRKVCKAPFKKKPFG